jgi:hypothetical protein
MAHDQRDDTAIIWRDNTLTDVGRPEVGCRRVGSGSPYKPQVIPLPDGTRFAASDRITFTTQASDPETALEIALFYLRWMRFVSGQASLGVDILGYEVQPDGPLTHLEISQSIALRLRLLKNVEGTALTFRALRSRLAMAADLRVPVYAEVLLDAVDASDTGDVRKAILYAAIAVEVMATTKLDDAFKEEVKRGAHSLSLVTRALPGGKTVQKDPLFDQLHESAKRNFRILLHELPLYVSRRSLLVDNEEMYQQLLKLHATRNDLVHTGGVGGSTDRLPVDHDGAKEAMRLAIAAFQWFGAEGRYVPTIGAS